MAKSINRVVILGVLGKNPEVRYTPSGTALATFSMATSERFKDKSGSWQEKTEWHNVKAWAKLGEIVGEYLKKGDKAYIEGRLETESWEDKNSGEKKYRTVIIANDLVLLGGKRESSEQSEPEPDSPF